jgi:hypothetical protein
MELVSLNLYCRKLFNDSINFIQIIFIYLNQLLVKQKFVKQECFIISNGGSIGLIKKCTATKVISYRSIS